MISEKEKYKKINGELKRLEETVCDITGFKPVNTLASHRLAGMLLGKAYFQLHDPFKKKSKTKRRDKCQ